MSSTPLEIIKSFCLSHGHEPLVEKLLLHNYYEEYQTAYNNEAKNGKANDETITSINNILLSEKALSKNVIIVKGEIESIRENTVSDTKKQIKRENFWLSVWASMVASFFFTLLLILLLAVANNQVKYILDQYFQPKSETIPNPPS